MPITPPPRLRLRLRRSALLACLISGLATAEESSHLPEVVVTGTAVAQDRFDAPLSIDVIDLRQRRASRPGIDVSEMLIGVPGVHVANRHNYAQDLQLSIRGFGSRSAFGVRGVRLMADGVPATGPDGQGQAATFDLDTADRIEVLRGPFATLYGNHSGGVVQLFSAPGEGPPRVEAGMAAGAWGTTRLRAGAQGEREGFAWRLNTSRLESDGHRRHSDVRRAQNFARLDFTGTPGRRVTLIANTLHQPFTQDPQGLSWAAYRRDPRGVENNALEYDTRKSINHRQATLRLEQDFGTDTLQLQAYAGQRSVVQYLSIPRAAQGNPLSAGGVVAFDRDFHGLGARWSQTREMGGGALTFTVGTDLERSVDDRKGYENFAGNQLGVRGALRRDETNTLTRIDPYVQAVWERGDWQWSAGLRHSTVRIRVDDDYITGANGDDSGSVTYRRATPAFAVLWRAHPSLHLYASAGTGFETPTLGELSYSAAGGSFNFGLKPTLSRQFEAGLKARLGTSTRVNAALFAVRTRDEVVIAESLGGRTSYTNAARTARNGLELGLESALTRTLELNAGLTWMEAEYTRAFRSGAHTIAAGNRLPGVPRLTASAELGWQATPGLRLAAEAVYRGDVKVDDRNLGRSAPSYAVANLSLVTNQQHGPWRFEQMLRVDNVFDRQHISSVIVGQAAGNHYEAGHGRGWFAGANLSYAF